MENKNQVFNLPLASFTFGKNENQIETNMYMNNSKSLYMNVQPNMDTKKAPIQPSLSQDYLQSNKYNKYNTSLSNNFSNNVQKMIDSNKNTNTINFNNSNYFNNTNQSSKMINLNYGGELTFGQSNEMMKNFNKENNSQSDFNNVYNNSLKNNYFSSKTNSNNDTINLKNIKDIKDNPFFPFFLNENKNDVNSYIIVILYSIYHMRPLKEYIINLNFGEQQGNINNKEINNNILYSLKKIYHQIGNNSNMNININELKESLSYLFNNRSKFIMNQPDDAVDLFFVILNAIHSFSIKSPLNQISDELCNNSKCFSHKYIWMDLTRIDECECNGTSRRLFSNHNYITDIPMSQIFTLINNYSNKNPKYILAANYQKLFFYYKELLHNMNMNCPLNGNRCNINKIHHRLFLGNSPSYFIFHLDYNQSNNNIFNSYSMLNILKCFVLISKSLNISTLFEENIRNKNDYNFNKNYNFIGLVFLSLTKIYSCAFKSMNINNNNILYNYFNGDNYLSFNNFYDLVVYSLKNGLIPIMLFYQDNQINNNLYDNFKNDILSKEQINQLEKYSINIDNLLKTVTHNKIRNNENVLMTNSQRNINNNFNNIPANSQNINQPNKNNKNIINKNINNQIINNENIIDNNYYNNNLQHKYNSNSYKVKSNINQNINLNQLYSETEVRSSLKNQNQNNYSNNNNVGDNYYSANQIKNMKANDNNNIMNNENTNNKKYKKVNEYEINNKNNGIQKSNNEEFSINNWDLPMPYIHYKKEEPIAILPIQNQTSIEVNTKNNSNNYFYRKHINNMQINNVNNPVDIKKSEFKQKSNSYTKKHGENIKSIINRLNSNNNNNNINPNSDNGNNIKNRIPLNKEYKINTNNSDYNRNVNINYSYNYNNNPNSFNKNHNLRNIIKDKYAFNKINKSNFDISSNRPSNFRYDNNNNISNISYNNNQNVRNISDDIIFSEEIKKKFKNKKLINQMINYSSNNKAKSNINAHKNNNNEKIVSKSDDNSNSNIYNFNYIYNNNNFDMNIVGNNVDKNNVIHKSYEKTKNNLKRNNNNNIININNISNVNSNNSVYNNEKDNKNFKNVAKSNDNGHWTCDYCSNINREDYMYCKICKRSKNGKILRINTQILNYKHSQKAHSKKVGNRSNAHNRKNTGIQKKKSIKSNNSNKINNSNKNNKYSLKKFKRNTMVGFSSTKKFNDNINYNDYINQDNQDEKFKDFNNMELKKEYSFTKASFDNRKYNIY